MIVLGIDPGTAALGYGIVERTGSRLREVDHGCLVTSPDLGLPERLLAIHALVDELLGLHQPRPDRGRAAVLLPERADGDRGWPGARCGPARGRAARDAGPRGDARTRSRARSRDTAPPTRSRSSGWSSSCSG